MRITKISAVILVGFMVLLSGCASPAATVPSAPPAPVAAAPVAAAPATAAPAPAAPAPVAAAPVAPSPAAPAPVAPVAPAPAAPVRVVAPTPVPGQPVFIVKNLMMASDACVAGDNVTASVEVTNTGTQQGTYTVVLKFNGEIVKTQDVTLDGGTTKKVELIVQPNVVGVYTVTVNDQLPIKFEVAACPV